MLIDFGVVHPNIVLQRIETNELLTPSDPPIDITPVVFDVYKFTAVPFADAFTVSITLFPYN